MNKAEELVQKIKDARIKNTTLFFEVENDEHKINIWFNRSFGKWVLQIDNKMIDATTKLEWLVDELVELKLI